MPRLSRKKNLKIRIQVDEEKNTKASHQTDISSFFKKQEEDESSSDSLRLPEGALPSPDDAALPCSTSLCSDNTTLQDGEKVLSEKSENTAVPDENTQNTSEMTNKNNQGASQKKKTKKPTQPFRNSQLTDFFPIRRSRRTTKPQMLKEKHKIIEDAILAGKEDGFEVKEFPEKGRGVVTKNSIKRGEYVMEYSGELIGYDEAMKREQVYSTKENTGCYMYYFTALNKKYCVDATKESGRLGRLINHSKKGNLKTQAFYLEDSPHLALFASRDIQAGEELCYDYGDRTKQALESHPWLAY